METPPKTTAPTSLKSHSRMDPTQKRRAERLQAIGLMIKQLRQSGDSWSDGRMVIKGEALSNLRHKMSHKAIECRTGTHPVNRTALEWGNFRNICRLTKSGDGLTRRPDQRAFQEVMSESLAKARSLEFPASETRAVILARALRKHAPDAWADLPLDIRHSQRELSHIVEAFNQRAPVISPAATIVVFGTSILIPDGTPVRMDRTGGLHFNLPGLEGAAFPFHQLDPCLFRPARLSRNTQPAVPAIRKPDEAEAPGL